MNMCYGCITNAQTPEVMAEIKASAVPWDGDINNTPAVVDWSSFAKVLPDMPDIETKWWTKFDWQKYFTPSQEYRPNCAGFGLANASMMRTLIQTGFQFSEQRPEKFNPFMCWLLSKNGSTWGGQSIGAMAQYGNKVGNFLASDIGDYDPAKASTRRSSEADEHAKQHQICYCLYEGNDPAEAVLMACRKGFTVLFGNSVGVASGRVKDENGVEVVRISGSWAHAHAGGGFQIVNGTRYIYWMNSHGPIYQAQDGTPPIGGWMPESTLRRFLSGSFADVCFIVYAECPYNTSIKPSLNPEVA